MRSFAGLKTKNIQKRAYRGEAEYGRSIRSGVRGFWQGVFDYAGFVDSMVSAIDRGFTRAWYEGIATCGLLPSDMTAEENARLSQEIYNEIAYVGQYAQAVAGNTRGVGKLTPLLERSDMWTNRYLYIRDLATTYACGDQKLMWVMGARCKEHCSSCTLLNSRVYRASTWRANDISPRDRKLECGGYKCCCEFASTNMPITPGPFPTIF